MADTHPILRFARWLLETTVMIGFALLLALVVRTAVAEAFEVPTASMEPTIMIDDRVVAEKISIRLDTPDRGDIVVFADPTGGPIPYVKRVIALPGETVDIRDSAVWVDGERLSEPYTHGLPSEPANVGLPVTVPPDHLWLMGDNRTDSTDSRSFGAVPVDTLRAKALFVYWPPERAGDIRGSSR